MAAARSDDGIEVIPSEVKDRAFTPARYTVISYPADFTLEVLVGQLDTGRIAMPEFQRGYVWNQVQASRLIESFLLGLPVPPVFLFKHATDGKHYLLDGQQRLRTVSDFFKGVFGHGRNVRGKTIQTQFKLLGLNEKSPYADKTFEELGSEGDAVDRLKNATLRSMIVQQLDPKDNGSIYHIFQRLNEGGTLLRGQEIRNCVYHGSLNELIKELNKNTAWREIFGKPKPDLRMRDAELILRFFALYEKHNIYEKPMNEFMNRFMGEHQNPDAKKLKALGDTFSSTADNVRRLLGSKPFHIFAGLNSGAFDAVFLAFALNRKPLPSDIAARYKKLTRDDKFINSITGTTGGTTDEGLVRERRERASQILFG